MTEKSEIRNQKSEIRHQKSEVRSQLIYERLAKIFAEVPAVSKDKQMESGQKYSYRSIDDIVIALKPLLAKQGVMCFPRLEAIKRETLDREKGGKIVMVTVEMMYNFVCCEDVSSIEIGPIPAEAIDYGDKATAKALTMALKAMFSEVFLIPTQDNLDTDSDAKNLDDVKTTPEKEGPPAKLFREPTEAEWEIIQAVTDQLIENGITIVPDQVKTACWDAQARYPSHKSQVGSTVLWLQTRLSQTDPSLFGTNGD